MSSRSCWKYNNTFKIICLEFLGGFYMIYVTNIKRMPKAEYIGRFNPRIGKESPLHNPFRLQKHEAKGSTLERYERYLDEKIAERDPIIMNELNRLIGIARQGDLYLGCWCSPQPCHGDIIRAKLIDMMEEQTMTKVKRVAIIGSRDINEATFKKVSEVAALFVKNGWEVSTGCADGADHAAMVGTRQVDPTKLHVFLPWASYNSEYHEDTDNTIVYNPKKHKTWTESVNTHHPNPSALKRGGFALHARNYGIVEDADLVVAFTIKKNKTSGTDQGVRVAKDNGIPAIHGIEEVGVDAIDAEINEVLGITDDRREFNITVVGTQKFHDYDLFSKKCGNILLKLAESRKIVIHPKCGEHITHMAERFAQEHGFTVRKTNHTKPHGLIAFHDGKSKIVGKQIETAQAKNLQVRVIQYESYEVCP